MGEIIKTECECGEPVHVELGRFGLARPDGKRPHHPGGNNNSTQLRCRKCHGWLPDTCKAAAFGKRPNEKVSSGMINPDKQMVARLLHRRVGRLVDRRKDEEMEICKVEGKPVNLGDVLFTKGKPGIFVASRMRPDVQGYNIYGRMFFDDGSSDDSPVAYTCIDNLSWVRNQTPNA